MKTAITLGLLAFMGRIGSITGLSSESLSFTTNFLSYPLVTLVGTQNSGSIRPQVTKVE